MRGPVRLAIGAEENRLEAPPSFWFVVIPEIVYELGRPQSRVPRTDAVAGNVTISKQKAEELKVAPSCSQRSMKALTSTNMPRTSAGS